VGAWILGRNMFGPVRGPWATTTKGDSWNGWWGDNPPYHTPVFVLTHHARPPLAMEGGTTFHFVTDGLESALKRAKEAAQGKSKNKNKDVRIGGGVSVIRQYLLAGQIDEMHLAVSPVLLGEGENLFSGLDLPKLGFTPFKTVAGENATHFFIGKG
jgi:dihydrofolate reductase